MPPSKAETALAHLAGTKTEGLPRRAIISTRGTAFTSHQQLARLLQGLPGAALLTLEDLNRPEVEKFVRKVTTSDAEAKAALRKIAEVHDLGELAQRPALLDLIVRNHVVAPPRSSFTPLI